MMIHTNEKRTTVFAEKIVVHGRTPLSVVPAPILGDIYVRAARMRGEDAVQILWADGPDPARLDLARTLRAFLVEDDGLFIEADPEKRLRPWKKHDDPTLNEFTRRFREATGAAVDPSHGLAMLAQWSQLAGHKPEDWISSPGSEFVLPWFKGSLANGATKPWIDTFAEAGAASGPIEFPLGNLKTVPSKACAEGLYSTNLLSSGILARNYLEHLDPQWLRFQLASWFRGNDRDWEMDPETFFTQGRVLLHRGVARLAYLCILCLHASFDGELEYHYDKAGAMLDAAHAKALEAAAAYKQWNFADAVKAAYDIAKIAHDFLKEPMPWNICPDTPREENQACYSAGLAAFRLAAICLAPVLPDFAVRAARIFGEPAFSFSDLDSLPRGRIRRYLEPLLPDLYPELFDAMVEDALKEEDR